MRVGHLGRRDTVNGYEATVLAEQWHRESAENGVDAEAWNAARHWMLQDVDQDDGYLP